MSIRKGNKIIAGNGAGGSGESITNQNPYSDIRQVYDWIGTLDEYNAQDIDNTHPEWVCFVTDDVDIVLPEDRFDKIATNCLTKIPQDIKLEKDDVNNRIIIKAGSKLYYPDGFEADGTTKKFSSVVLSEDLYDTDIQGLKRIFLVCRVNDLSNIKTNTAYVDRNSATSQGSESGTGPTPDATTHLHCLYYNLTDNKIYFILENRAVQVTFPLCIENVNETTSPVTKSIEQIFNGFGYIGSVLFALPGIEALTPNGRNADGTLHSIKEKNSSVLIYETTEETTVNNYIRFRSSELGTGVLQYNADENENYLNSKTTIRKCCVAGMYSKENGKITSIKPKFPMAQMDMNILELIYPVGSIYIGTQNTSHGCPLRYIISNSEWELVSSGKALWIGDGTNANTTIEAGLPNITGNATGFGSGQTHTYSDALFQSGDASGTFEKGSGGHHFDLGFDASKSNSIYGSSTTVQPPAYVVNVWRRTA